MKGLQSKAEGMSACKTTGRTSKHRNGEQWQTTIWCEVMAHWQCRLNLQCCTFFIWFHTVRLYLIAWTRGNLSGSASSRQIAQKVSPLGSVILIKLVHVMYDRHKQHRMVTHDELLSSLGAATCTDIRHVTGTQPKHDKNNQSASGIPKWTVTEQFQRQPSLKQFGYRGIVLLLLYEAIRIHNLRDAIPKHKVSNEKLKEWQHAQQHGDH